MSKKKGSLNPEYQRWQHKGGDWQIVTPRPRPANPKRVEEIAALLKPKKRSDERER